VIKMAEEFVQEQQVEQPQRKKKKEEQKTGFPVGRQFDIGKVFGPEAAKEEDLEVDLSRFKARHGEGGTRGFGYYGSGCYDIGSPIFGGAALAYLAQTIYGRKLEKWVNK
jgi:hypothetical protein